MDSGAWLATVHRVTKSWTRLRDFTFLFYLSPHDRKIRKPHLFQRKESRGHGVKALSLRSGPACSPATALCPPRPAPPDFPPTTPQPSQMVRGKLWPFLFFLIVWKLLRTFPIVILSSPTRDRTCIRCVGRQILNHWTTRKVLRQNLKNYQEHQKWPQGENVCGASV